uniref:Uncharacterized protein n=1 Tax=Myoviridae sp. ctJ2i1 TaxID=2825079 RepID=A0A8S5V1W8_9CAUD|nr:MAG TPA: hypothetical protein [Myoviridae sp. ctJ2i1]
MIVQPKTLLFDRHHYVHLMLSHEHRLYLVHIFILKIKT